MIQTNDIQSQIFYNKAWAYLQSLMIKMVSTQADHIIITNINVIKKDNKAYYGLVFKRNQVIYANRAPFLSQIYTLDLKNKKIKLNNRDIEEESLLLILKRIRLILWELEDNQAKVFEKVKN